MKKSIKMQVLVHPYVLYEVSFKTLSGLEFETNYVVNCVFVLFFYT